MSIHDDVNINALTRAAATIGATLPDHLAAAVEHYNELKTEQAPNVSGLAAEIASHVGNPTAFDKARKAALLTIASAAAGNELRSPLLDRAGAVVWQRIRNDREKVAAAFREALADDLDALNANAGKLPEHFTRADVESLSPGCACLSAATPGHAVTQAVACRERAHADVYALARYCEQINESRHQ